MKISGPYEYRSKPWRLYHRGQQSWYDTEEDAQKAANKIGTKGRRMSKRQVDEFWHCTELMQGSPILRAVRYYVEHHDGRMKNAGSSVDELIELFKSNFTGRPKYVKEAKRSLTLLADHCGELRITAVTPSVIEEYLNGFASKWSYDQALKFARSFFKWCIGAKVRALRENPTAEFDFKKPGGSRVYLALDDVAHLLKICKDEFPDIMAAVRLQLFAGIRTEEITRLDWKYVKRGKIRLEPEVAKMGQVKGKRVPRFVDWWPIALDVDMPNPLPTSGPVAPVIERKVRGGKVKLVSQYLRLKGKLLERCRETKKNFTWGQNAFRHSYGTYGLGFFQSADRIAKLMGERDVDTVFNHYAEYETAENGQLFFSTGADRLESFPMPKNALQLIQTMVDAAQPKTMPPAASGTG